MVTRPPCLPLEQRIRLHHNVLQLREQGLSCRGIIKTIDGLHGIRLSVSTIECWVRGLNSPLERVNKFDANPSPTLAYIIGTKASDGWLCKDGNKYVFGLNSNDFGFADVTGRCLSKLLRRNEPYRPRWDNGERRWRVSCRCVLLYQFLLQPFEKLRPYIEHCKNCVAAFLRGFYDGDRSIEGRKLTVYNTNFELLRYIQYILRQYFEIEATNPHRKGKKGQSFRGANGKVYRRRKDHYRLYVRVTGLSKFHQHIGFTIKRKQLGLVEAIQKQLSLLSFAQMS